MMESFFRILVAIIGQVIKRRAQSDQARRDYIAFVEIMDRMGWASVNMRLTAANQIQVVQEMWKKDEGEK